MQPGKMEHTAIVTLLKTAEQLTKDLDDAELEKLASVCLVEKCDAGDLLTKEDERSRDLFVVVEGTLSVEVLLSPNDKETVSMMKIRPGGVAGELSFVDGSRRSAGLKSVGHTTVVRLPHDKVHALCETEKGIGYKVMRNLAALVTQRLRTTNFELRSHLT